MKLLRLATTINSTSAPYNQFSLGLKGKIDQTLCSLLQLDGMIDEDIEGFHGDGTILKMLKLVRSLVAKNKYDVVIHLVSLDHNKSEDDPNLVSSINVLEPSDAQKKGKPEDTFEDWRNQVVEQHKNKMNGVNNDT